MPAALETLRAQPFLPIRQALPQGVDRPRIVIPVDGPGHTDVRLRQQQRPAVEVVKAVLGRKSWQNLAIELKRVAALVVLLGPDIVIAGHQRLAAWKIGKESQAGR